MSGGWLAARCTDFGQLVASWRVLRGQWSTARASVTELVEHRRVLVKTTAALQGGTPVVLSTRLRLQGDTQTDILGPWLRAAPPGEIARVMAAHGRALQAKMDGFAAALSLERLAARAVALLGTAASLLAVLWSLIASPPRSWPHLLLAHWWLAIGFAVALMAALLRIGLGFLLRRRFRRALR